MDWFNLIINVIAIFIGLGVYLIIMHTKWGREHEQYQFAIMLAAVLAACLVGGILRVAVQWLVA